MSVGTQSAYTYWNGSTWVGNPYASVAVDMGGAMLLPAFTDMHTHLDKGHIWPRQPNPDGTFMGALTTVMADREANWSATDVRMRMEFALRAAQARLSFDVRPVSGFFGCGAWNGGT